MPSRNSTVPNLDLKSLKTDTDNGKISSPLTPGAQSSDGLSPLTPRSPKSGSSSPFFKGTTIRPVTQDSSTKATSPTIPPLSGNLTADTAPEPSTPGLTAIPQYFPSPNDSSKHTRDASKSFFGTLKAPKSSHRTQRSDSSENSTEPPKSRCSSRDRKSSMTPKMTESIPDLPTTIGRAAETEKSKCSYSANLLQRKLLTTLFKQAGPLLAISARSKQPRGRRAPTWIPRKRRASRDLQIS